MRLFFGKVLSAAALIVAFALLGCGGSVPKGIQVHGRLLKNGQPAEVDIVGKQLPPGDSGRMSIEMYPVKSENEAIADENGETLVPGGEVGSVDVDGKFHFDTTGAAKAGKYRFVITHIDPSSGQDLLKGVFNAARSKITRDVTPDQEIVIDLGKPGG